MNNSYDRLLMLFEQLGIPALNGTEDRGELMAYCAGIDMIRHEFETQFGQIFADTATGLGLSQYCALLKTDNVLSESEKRACILQGLSERYGSYMYGDFEKALDKQCPMLIAASMNFYITINGSVKNDYDQLFKLGRVLENYLPPCTMIGFSGNGFNFDYWDSTPYLFEDYDSFNLNFELLDELE